MIFLRKILPAWADHRVSAAIVLLAGAIAAFAVFSVTTPIGEDAPDNKEGKAERAAATPDLSKAPCQDPGDCQPPAPRSRFIDEKGFFALPEWDDRNLSKQEKAANPWKDPFWPPFVQCLQDAGIGVGLTTPDSATQEDINRLVDEVNKAGPFYTSSPTGLVYKSTQQSDAFIQCEKILYERRPDAQIP